MINDRLPVTIPHIARCPAGGVGQGYVRDGCGTFHQQASVLSIVLVLMFVLFFIGIAIATRITTGTRIAGMDKIQTNAIYLAEAGIERSLWRLQPDMDWSDDSPPSDLYTDETLGKGSYTVCLAERRPSSLQIIATGKIGEFVKTVSTSVIRGGNWWHFDYGYRRQLTIINSSATTLPASSSVALTLDTASLVADGKMRVDGNDVRIVFQKGTGWVELDRLIIDPGSSESKVWFATHSPIGAGEDDSNYVLYYGAPSAPDPPADMDKVCYFADDFNRPDSDSLGEKWNNPVRLSICQVINNQAELRLSAGVDEGYVTARLNPIRDFIATYRVYIRAEEGSFLFRTNEARLPAYLNRSQVGTGRGVLAMRLTNTWQTLGTNTWSPRVRTWYNIKLEVLTNALKCYVDDILRLNVTDSQLITPGIIGFYLGVVNARAYYDDVIVRTYHSPEPVVNAGREENLSDVTKPQIIFKKR